MNQQPDNKPGLYYVSVQRGTDYRLLAGPFEDDHVKALSFVEPARTIAEKMDPRAVWYAYGTCRIDKDVSALPPRGMLNAQLGLQ